MMLRYAILMPLEFVFEKILNSSWYCITSIDISMITSYTVGVVQPSTMGDDGRPVPVEHVLQLAPQDSQASQEPDDEED